MRICPVCARPTSQPIPRTGRYPLKIDPAEVVGQTGVSDREIEADLVATRRELNELRVEVTAREEFVSFLEKLQEARQT